MQAHHAANEAAEAPPALSRSSSGFVTEDESRNPLIAALKYDEQQDFNKAFARLMEPGNEAALEQARTQSFITRSGTQDSTALDFAAHYGRLDEALALKDSDFKSAETRKRGEIKVTRIAETNQGTYNRWGQKLEES